MEIGPQAQVAGAASSPASSVAPPRCPNCGWQDVRNSQSKGLLDFALGKFSVTPFRCRSCGSRFYKRRRKPEA